MKLKALPIFLIITLCSGCMMMSKERYLAASGDQVKRNNDAGGYYDLTWIRFGKGNNGVIKVKDYSVEIWSQTYYSKELAIGFIIPIIPKFGSWSNVTTTDQWIRIKNTSSYKDIDLRGITTDATTNSPIEYSSAPYPDHSEKNKEILVNQEVNIPIPANEFIWVCLPEGQEFKVMIQMGQQSFPVNLKETKGLTWWMVTV